MILPTEPQCSSAVPIQTIRDSGVGGGRRTRKFIGRRQVV